MVSPLLRLTLRQGSVYYLRHREVTSSEPHYLVVVNPDPLNDSILVFGVITSKVELRKKRIEQLNLPVQTLVLISPAEYSELRMDSAIDCNHPRKMFISELDIVIRNSSCECINMSPEICEKIYDGIMISPVVDEIIKKILSGK